MIKLQAEVSGQHHEITLQRRSQSVTAEIDGRKYKLEIRELGPDEYQLIDGHSVYDCRVENNQDERNRLEVYLRGRSHAITLTDPKRIRSGQSGTDHYKGLAEIVAPMPGKVVRVMIEVGAQVEAGTGILVVEAMKMQNEMKSPKAGVVVSIAAEPGATVNAGDVLAVVE